MASRPFYHAADRVLGSQFLEDVAEFFLNFQTMYPGFVERAHAVERLFHDRRTTFIVVTTLEAAPLNEAEFFIDAMATRSFHLGALVLNRVLPSYLLLPDAVRVAERLAADAPAIATQLPGAGAPEGVARVLREVSQSFLNFEVVAKREAELRAELATTPDVVASVPYFDTDITDMPGLVKLGRSFWGG
jgi:anion-transporting  ArsA/GET3 family ATPase